MLEICPQCSRQVRDRRWLMLLPGVSVVVCQCRAIFRIRQLGRVYSLAEMLSLDCGGSGDITRWNGLDFTDPIVWERIGASRSTSSLPPSIARYWAQLTLLQEMALHEASNFKCFWTWAGEHGRAIMAAVDGILAGYLIWTEAHPQHGNHSRQDYPRLEQGYVRPEYRRQKVATRLIKYWAERYVAPFGHKFAANDPNAYSLRVLADCGFHQPDATRAVYFLPRSSE